MIDYRYQVIETHTRGRRIYRDISYYCRTKKEAFKRAEDLASKVYGGHKVEVYDAMSGFGPGGLWVFKDEQGVY